MDIIKFDDFKKLDIIIGKIISAERVEDTDKLLKLEVDLGEEKRQLVAGIAKFYTPEQLVGKQIPVLANLEPRTFKGIESQGMILAASSDGDCVLIGPEKETPVGSKVK